MKRRATLLLIHILFTSFVNGFIHIMPFIKSKFPDLRNIVVEKPNSDFDGTSRYTDKVICDDDNYNLNWYVIGEESKMKKNQINKVTIWGKNYAVWNNGTKYFSIDDACSHRGASLSIGKLRNNTILCPYHAYGFDQNGTLTSVPGLENFINTPCQNLNTYPVAVRNGWVYMNTINMNIFTPNENNIKIFEEPESKDKRFKSIFLNRDFSAYSRIVTENSLDIMHIGFVHTFGNAKSPSPLNEVPPFKVDDAPFHYKTIYNYTSGENSMVKRIFQMDDLLIENEFILPHTTIARVIFGPFTSTIMTFALPVNVTHSKLFVKAYRNFWHNYDSVYFRGWLNNLGDYFTKDTMSKTIMQDKIVVESIPLDKVDGMFNMKYDKLQNIYTSLYKKLIHNISSTL